MATNLAMAKPPLGSSDHNIIQLLPRYRQKLKRFEPTIKKVKTWSEESAETLKACFEWTDWEVLIENTSLEAAVEVVTDYIKFCENMIVPEKAIKIYPNNKPWVDKQCKVFLNNKAEAFKNNDPDSVKAINKSFRKYIVNRKRQYCSKVENKFKEGNSKAAWQGLKLITGFESRRG